MTSEEDGEYDTLIRLAVGTGGAFSMAGALFVVVNYFTCRELKSYSAKLVSYLAVANFFSGLAFCLASLDLMCRVTAALMQFADVAGFVWTACIAANMFVLFVQNQRDKARQREKYYHIASWGFPLVGSIVIGASNCFGETDTWCWVKDHGVCQVYRWALFYAPLVIITMYCAVMYVRIIRDLRKKFKRMSENVSDQSNMNKFLKQQQTFQTRLSLYLLVFVGVRSFGLVHRLHTVAFPDERIPILEVIHAVVVPFHGFLNAMIYGVNPRLIRQYRMMFGRVCGVCVGRKGYIQQGTMDGAEQDHNIPTVDMGDYIDDEHELEMTISRKGPVHESTVFQIVGDDEEEDEGEGARLSDTDQGRGGISPHSDKGSKYGMVSMRSPYGNTSHGMDDDSDDPYIP